MKWNPFSRKPKPLNPGPINEDWRVGDLAECVTDDEKPWRPSGIGPAHGDIHTVLSVAVGKTHPDRFFLTFRGFPQYRYDAKEFRKLPPVREEASAEFTAQIKALQPKERARRMAATARRAA